jgi:hypothetical protein
MHYLSASTFYARKPIAIGDNGINSEASAATAPTHQWATSVGTNLPGLIGRIADRVAWRRVSNTQAQADAIVSQHTADSIRRGLDQSIEQRVVSVKAVVQEQLASLKIENGSSHVRYRTTPGYIEVALVPNGVTPEELAALPSIDGNPQIALRIHRSLLGQGVADQLAATTIPAAFTNFLEKRLAQKAISLLGTDVPADAIKCAADRNWLAVDFNNEDDSSTPPVAADTFYR